VEQLIDLVKGTLQLIVSRTLALHPPHGVGVDERIE